MKLILSKNSAVIIDWKNNGIFIAEESKLLGGGGVSCQCINETKVNPRTDLYNKDKMD